MIYFIGAAIGFLIGWFLHRWLSEKIINQLLFEIMQYRKMILELNKELANVR